MIWQMAASIALACATAEAAASVATSASSKDCLEDIGIVAVVEAELKLREIKREIFFAYVVKRSDDSALEQTPKAFDVVRMDLAAHVFMLAMLHGLMRQAKIVVTLVFIGRDQIDFFIDNLAHESVVSLSVGIAHHLADDVAFAADCADDAAFAEAEASTGLALLAALFVPVPIAILAADISLVYFYRSHQLRKGFILHCRTDAMAHEPSGAIVATADLSVNLKGADSFLGLAHQVDDLEPSLKRVVRVLEDRFCDHAETVAVATAAILVLTNPVKGPRLERIDFLALTARTLHAIGPAHIAEQRLAGVLVRIVALQLGERNVGLRSERLFGFNFGVHAEIISISNAGVKPNIIARVDIIELAEFAKLYTKRLDFFVR
jgi:hypothetical protein